MLENCTIRSVCLTHNFTLNIVESDLKPGHVLIFEYLDEYCISLMLKWYILWPKHRFEKCFKVYYLKILWKSMWSCVLLAETFSPVLKSCPLPVTVPWRAGHRSPLIDSESFRGKLQLWPSDTGTRTTTPSLRREPSIKLPLCPDLYFLCVCFWETVCVWRLEGGLGCLDHTLTARPGPLASVSGRGESDYLHLQIYPPRPLSPRTIPTSSPTSRKTSF